MELNEPIDKLSLPKEILDKLCMLGIRYIIQLATMTPAQLLCIKGIDNEELDTISASLWKEGITLADQPAQIIVSRINDKVIQPDDNLFVSVHADIETGKVIVSFPVDLRTLFLKPADAIGISERIAQKARTLMN